MDLVPLRSQGCVCSSEGDQEDLEVFPGVVELGDEGKGALAWSGAGAVGRVCPFPSCSFPGQE